MKRAFYKSFILFFLWLVICQLYLGIRTGDLKIAIPLNNSNPLEDVLKQQTKTNSVKIKKRKRRVANFSQGSSAAFIIPIANITVDLYPPKIVTLPNYIDSISSYIKNTDSLWTGTDTTLNNFLNELKDYLQTNPSAFLIYYTRLEKNRLKQKKTGLKTDYLVSFFSRNNLLEQFSVSPIDNPSLKPFDLAVKEFPTIRDRLFHTKMYNIQFGENDITERSDFQIYAQQLKIYLADNPSKKIFIEGHTDSIGPSEDNLLISRYRARKVKNYFVKSGITNVIDLKGFGSQQPIREQTTRAGRLVNRRIVIKVIEP